MTATQAATAAAIDKHGADWVAPDCQGKNFYDIDPAFQAILRHYMAPDLHAHLEPHLRRLGEIAGGRLDELARAADAHQPVLHTRDRYGRDEDWIEYHPARRAMERIAFEDFGLNRLNHTGACSAGPRRWVPWPSTPSSICSCSPSSG